MSDRYQSFAEFWPFYVGEHRMPRCRGVHYLGSFAAPVTLFWVVVTGSWLFLPLVLIAGYGPAWVGHFLIEKNRPATFQYPLWSLMADYKMLGLALRGKMADEAREIVGRLEG